MASGFILDWAVRKTNDDDNDYSKSDGRVKPVLFMMVEVVGVALK